MKLIEGLVASGGVSRHAVIVVDAAGVDNISNSLALLVLKPVFELAVGVLALQVGVLSLAIANHAHREVITSGKVAVQPPQRVLHVR